MNSGIDYTPKPLTIALDWDDTYTADPDLWGAFIQLARSRGHRVIICSCRMQNFETMADIRGQLPANVGVYLTSMSPKRWYLEERGVKVSVWIDDKPESVKEGR